MKLENLERVADLKEMLERVGDIIDILTTSDYCHLTIEDVRRKRKRYDVIHEETEDFKKIYLKIRDEVIRELKELGVEI
jgi:hypothetical protein